LGQKIVRVVDSVRLVVAVFLSVHTFFVSLVWRRCRFGTSEFIVSWKIVRLWQCSFPFFKSLWCK
jgi:hypothetical protein